MDPITFSRDVCRDFSRACTKEWIESNGLGGYASSTICLANTRRHHGLIVAAIEPPSRRHVLLSSLEDFIEVEGRKHPLSNHFYPGTVFPKGYETLIEFRQDPFPTFVYRIGETWLEKVFVPIYGENTLGVIYRLLGNDAPVRLFVRPLTACRDATQLTDENPELDPGVQTSRGQVSFQPYKALPALYFYHDAVVVEKEAYWYKNFEYPDEEAEEMGYREDIFSPFSLLYSFSSSDEVFLVVTTDPKKDWDFGEAFFREKGRRERILENFPGKERAWGALWQTAESFLVNSSSGAKTLVAGYPALSDRTREALLSLHGLLLVRGKPEEAKNILQGLAEKLDGGFFPEEIAGAASVAGAGAVDVPLIFAEAAYDYLKYSEDAETLEKNLYPAVKKIFKAYREGIPGVLRMASDGLIEILDEKIPRTWMDAVAEEVPVTLRDGKAVEINALWYNAIRILGEWAAKFRDPGLAEECRTLSLKVKENFNRLFWSETNKCLYDAVKGNAADSSLRPNQIFAISSCFPVLEETRWKAVLAAVEKELLTPYGLRTLDPGHPNYAARYEGREEEKSKARHQGSVRPWLLGPFFVAALKASGDPVETRAKLKDSLNPLLEHLEDFGLGTVSEIFDGEAPHFPRGSASHALAVAELLRIYEILKGIQIPSPKPKEIILR